MKAYPHKVIADWLRILAISLECKPELQLGLPAASENVTETQDEDVGMLVCRRFWDDLLDAFYGHRWELLKSVGSHGSSSQLFAMTVMV
jgi:hypothetical protein